MKQLKSSAEDLREIFDNNITVRHIAESLCSFDKEANANEIKNYMCEVDYDVVGVRDKGIVAGYAERAEIIQGVLGDYIKGFNNSELLTDTASLINALEVLKNSDRVFVSSFGEVSGIITRGDLQKQPVRMWIFALISLIEMQMLRIIRICFSEDQWGDSLGGRIEKAKTIYNQRKNINEAIDLADCLQLCDKSKILSESKEICRKLGYSKKQFKKFMGRLNKLRDNLAHSQDVITGNWPGIINLISDSEKLLKKCEDIYGLV